MNPLDAVKIIMIHCADTKSTMDFTMTDLARVHVEENGWDDIGYHYYIKFNGMAHNCRPTKYAGAHCKSVNRISLAICLEGGFEGENNFTQLQMDALWHLIRQIKQNYPQAAILGHNSIDDKACPSFDVVSWYEDRLEEVGLITAMGGLA